MNPSVLKFVKCLEILGWKLNCKFIITIFFHERCVCSTTQKYQVHVRQRII